LWLLAIAPFATVARDVPITASNVVANSFNGAFWIRSADMDGDGDEDLVGVAQIDHDVIWWENVNSKGTQWVGGPSRTLSPFFQGARSATPADLDRDGDVDVLGAAKLDHDVVWWENLDGQGTVWTSRYVDSSFSGAVSAVTCDLDRDGDPDVVAAANAAGEIAWWENLSGGSTSWLKRVIASGFIGAYSVRCGDLDGDGDPDVAASAEGIVMSVNRIDWWENVDGEGLSWSNRTVSGTYTDAKNLHIEDLDGDGDLDVIGTSSGLNRVNWWENRGGAGTNWVSRDIGLNIDGAHDVVAGDLDGDGDMDVAAVSSMDDEVLWWENLSGKATNWTEHLVSSVATNGRGVCLGDFDGDGDLEIAAAAASSRQVFWLKNDTIHRSASYVAASLIGSGYGDVEAVEVLDADRDGGDDLVTASSSGVYLHHNLSGSGSSWSSRVLDAFAVLGTDLVSLDADGDGWTDLAGVQSATASASLYLNAGPTGAWPIVTVATGWAGLVSIEAADFDRDGRPDLAGVERAQGTVAWFANSATNGSVWTTNLVATGLVEPQAMTVGDIDGNGGVDLVVADLEAPHLKWFSNSNRNGSLWTTNGIGVLATSVLAVAASDFDTDGDLDVVVSWDDLNGPCRATWFRNEDGVGQNWLDLEMPLTDRCFDQIRVMDLDQDGDDDLLMSVGTGERIGWYENVGGTNVTWSFRFVDSLGTEVRRVAAGDFDRDGDLDVAGGSSDGTVTWSPNQGGQFSLYTTNVLSSPLLDGQTSAVLRIAMDHRGRPDDRAEELAALTLKFEESPGDPLSSAEANALADRLRVFRDDGDAVFEPGADALVTSTGTLTLTVGTQTFTLPDASVLTSVNLNTGATFFVVVDLTTNASMQTPNQFRIVHLTEGGSRGEDYHFDIPLSLEFASNSASAVAMVAAPGGDSDGDGMPDDWEFLYFGHPTNGVAGADEEGDLILNLEEYVMDTSPLVSNAWLTIAAGRATAGVFRVDFTSSAARLYTLELADDPRTGIWVNAAGQTDVPGVGGTTSLTNDTDRTFRVYRIHVHAP